MHTHRSRIWSAVVALALLLATPLAAGTLRPIAIREADDDTDLAFLDTLLEGKRIVLLGESNHGSREFNLQKIRLIRYLYERLGYRVLLLESGIGEVYAIDHERDELSEQQMLSGLIGPWRTLEYAELISYLKNTPGLRVGGYDVQRSGRSFGGVLREVRLALGSDETTRFEGLEDRFSTILAKLKDRTPLSEAQLNQLLAEGGGLVEDYATTRVQMERSEALALEKGWTVEQWSTVRRTLQNRIEFLGYYAMFKVKPDYRERWAARDSVMADNVRFFANRLYPDAKIIVSGHNYHIARRNENERVMGEALAESFDDSLYAIGLFAGKGSFANNSRQPEAIEKPGGPGDLAHHILALDGSSTFVDVPDRRTEKTSWLLDDLTVSNSFVDLEGRESLKLGQAFDGLILIREVSPARFARNP